MLKPILNVLVRAAAWSAHTAISLFALAALDVTLRPGRKLRKETEARDGGKAGP